MSTVSVAAASTPPARVGRRKSEKPTPLDPASIVQSPEPGPASTEGPLKSPTTPGVKKPRREEDATAAATASATASSSSPTPSTSRAPPLLTLSTPSPAHSSLDSPRPAPTPVKSAAFSELERRADDSQTVRLLVIQIEREMRAEIDRLKVTHAVELETATEQFNGLAEMLQRKREEWSLQMAAKETCMADLQNDLISLIKSEKEAQLRADALATELEKEHDENDRLRQLVSEMAAATESTTKASDGEKKRNGEETSPSEFLISAEQPGPSGLHNEKRKRIK